MKYSTDGLSKRALLVLGHMAKSIGVEPDDIDRDASLKDVGFDSLDVIEMTFLVENSEKITIKDAVTDCRSINEILSFVDQSQ